MMLKTFFPTDFTDLHRFFTWRDFVSLEFFGILQFLVPLITQMAQIFIIGVAHG